MISYDTKYGTVSISNEYLSKLIGNAVSSCYGVVGMAPGGKRQHLLGMVSKKEYSNKGIVIKEDEEGISVDLHIIVLYGMNISAIAKSIVNKVRFTVDEAVGVKVDKVTVKVDGIQE